MKSQNKNRSNILGVILALPLFQDVFKYIILFDLHENQWEEKELLSPHFRQSFLWLINLFEFSVTKYLCWD